MSSFKKWSMPIVAFVLALGTVAFTLNSSVIAVYANSTQQRQQRSTEPPRDLINLVALLEATLADAKQSEYARWSWESVFNPMPMEASASVNKARTVEFSNGVKAHICWCLGMKVQTYDPAIDLAGETEEGFMFYQHPITRDLIITDNKTLVAYYNVENGYTWTFSYDGGRAIRFSNFSFYAFANGRWSIAEVGGSTEIKKDGIFQPGVFDKSYGDWTLDEIIKINDEMTQRFMTWFMPLNWEEIPWLQDAEE